ncbi:hypothetical protein HK100_005391, partial [Physocladia obscura]
MFGCVRRRLTTAATRVAALTAAERSEHVALLESRGWRHEKGPAQEALAKQFRFSDFGAAFGFMARVAVAAERDGHHPEWANVYATVDVRLTTHDAGNALSMKDVRLATQMDEYAAALLGGGGGTLMFSLGVGAPHAGGRLAFAVGDADSPALPATPFVLVRRGEALFCIEAVCPHSGGPLANGLVEDIEDVLVCPWHHFRFSLRSGACFDDPLHAARTLDAALGKHGHVTLQDRSRPNLFLVDGSLSHVASPGPVTTLSSHVSPTNDSLLLLPNIGDGRVWSLVDWSIRVLNEPDPSLKVQLTQHIWHLWNNDPGQIPDIGHGSPPNEPARDNSVQKVAHNRTRRIKKGSGLTSRLAILHSLASIEQWAIDLAFDIIARFSTVKAASSTPLPRAFFHDFLKVANDEAKHYSYLVARLEAFGSYFGALPIHGALWESAERTSGDLLARLAVVH